MSMPFFVLNREMLRLTTLSTLSWKAFLVKPSVDPLYLFSVVNSFSSMNLIRFAFSFSVILHVDPAKMSALFTYAGIDGWATGGVGFCLISGGGSEISAFFTYAGIEGWATWGVGFCLISGGGSVFTVFWDEATEIGVCWGFLLCYWREFLRSWICFS